MAVALRLVDIGLAQRSYAVAQHGARGCVDQSERQPLRQVVGGGDDITTLLDKEVGPGLQLVIVDRLDVAHEEILDLELRRDVHAGARVPYTGGRRSRSRAPPPR